MKVYDFINNGLNNFNLDSLYTSEIKEICIGLNKILNDVSLDIDYSDYLRDENVSYEIQKLYKKLFLELHKFLYVDLSDIVFLLKDFQANRKIQGERYRDHFYHSIQCFLLGLSLYNFIASNTSLKQNTDILITIFSICMYHDLGYLYLVTGENLPCINDDLKSKFDCQKNWTEANKLKEMLCIQNVNTDRFIQCCSSCELLTVWRHDIESSDNDLLRLITNVQFGRNFVNHHSYESAVLAARILTCKQRIIQELNNTTLNDRILSSVSCDENEQLFKEIIKIILLHDYRQERLLTFQTDFWSCFLMLIDEMQTYGRTYQDENMNYKVLNPIFIEFQFDSANKLKLFPSATLPQSQNKLYASHSNEKIISELKEKIEQDDLKKIFA